MKNSIITIFTGAILIAAVFISSSYKESQLNEPESSALALKKTQTDPNTCVESADIGDSDIIKVNGYMKSPYNANIEVQATNDYIRCTENRSCTSIACMTTVANIPLKVRPQAIKDLADGIKTIAGNIHGLKIYFGLEGNKVIFIFQPIIMNNPRQKNKVIFYDIVPHGPAVTYDETNENFVPIGTETMNTLTTNYVNNIRIVHDADNIIFDSIITEYRMPDSWQRDSRSVIFSFQEIFYMTKGNFYCLDWTNKYLYFYHSVALYKQRRYIPATAQRNKHTIVISCEPLPSTTYYYTLAANYAHLCPPSCSVYYQVE